LIVRQRSQIEEQLIALQQLQQIEQQQQQMKQQQQLQQLERRLLIAALTTQQQRRLSSTAHVGRSDSAPSAVRYTPRAPLRSSPSPPFSAKTAPMKSSMCDSLGSLGVSSPPSSVSESPTGSPSFAMFGGGYASGEETTYSSLPAISALPYRRDVFSRSNSSAPPGFGHRVGNCPSSFAYQATPPAAPDRFYQSNEATPTSGNSFVYPPGSPFSAQSPAVSAFSDSSSAGLSRSFSATRPPPGANADSFPAAEVVAATSFLDGATAEDIFKMAALLQELAVTKAAASGLQPLSPPGPLTGASGVGTGWERGFQDAAHFSAAGEMRVL
jgi:hypothetical protein